MSEDKHPHSRSWLDLSQLWSRDVLFALLLSIMAAAFVGLTWMSGSASPRPPAGTSAEIDFR
jgi:hypothetical protein